MASYYNWAGGIFGGQPNLDLQSEGMLTKEQLLQLFRDFSSVLDQPETKSRIADAIKDEQEAVNVTTEIQEELFLKMGVDPKFGIECLGKVNTVYSDDRDLMIQFYQFVSREEMACEEAELGPEAFARKMEEVKKSQQQQRGMLQQLRAFPVDQQQAFFQMLQSKMHEVQSEGGAAMTTQEIQEFFQHQQTLLQRKGSPSSQQYTPDNSGTSGTRPGSQPKFYG
ncbi:uncharacterized protein [Physcomitrium patens]|uniref:Uncharacterized protein n=1 Tax=Physcomitrium patens TaxID=3218 RepID=A0A2K1L9X1_PHYPA|nr:uncharacterized protein LOC112279205 [Physcomitrium patens]XP_024369193.1 uncharacterized protein LOC112279205 [Physcomitrium patens]XP_024369201.1 uncharacterized protein LOC112279205 [Physcomitrium patens]XP_024369210.1 uncharacterized protein LOC112279205 [Physcomitrium patens]PNR62820.1 hypothetical protein PHYPA_001244 [Physcomitrium patens]|eukprot:XP_024369183.1 uncharacterized protein LOC112279205 [Physcomitrella patens]